MADEQLRLVASLRDNASPGIKNIGKQLKNVRVEPGMAQAQKWVRGFNEDVAKFKRSSMTVANVMSAMGVGGLAAAGSIGALAGAFKALADRTLDMKELGREVGLTADEINAMNRAGQHFGIDPSVMQGAIKHLAGLMPEFKRGYGELNSVLARQPDLIKRLRVEDTKAQIKDLMAFLDTIKNPQDRMVFDRAIFGTDEMEKAFKDGSGGFEAQAEKFRQTLAPITEAAAAQAQQLRDAINDFNAAVDNLELKAGPTVYKWLTAGVTELGAVLQQVEKAPGDVAAAAGVIAGSLAALRVRNRIVRGSSLAGGAEMRAAAGSLSGAAGGIDKSAIALNEAAIALKEAAVELRSRGPSGPGPVAPTEPVKPGAPEVVEDAPKGLLGKGGLKGLGAGLMEGLFSAMLYKAGEEAMDSLLHWTPANQKELDRATSLPNVIKDIREQWFGGKAAPAAAGFHVPDAYNREQRARIGGDGQDHTLDGVVVGSVEKPVLHLAGTLKTAAAQAERDGIKPAAFRPAGFGGSASDTENLLASGVKEGMLAAMREWAGGASSADPSTARGGIMPASFGGGGSMSGSRALGGGSFGGGSYGDPSKSLLDFIAKSEGGGYNVSWGNGKFLPGGHEENLTGKSLNEILALGDVMRRQPGARNSSAMGRYQITGSTLRDLMRRMGLNGSEKYDEAMQDRLASRLISDEGPRALQRWEGLKNGGRMSTALGLLRSGQIAPQPEASGPMVGLQRVGQLASEQCVALANAAVQFRGSVTEWRKGDGAEAGTLKPGTPVATFLDRLGRETNRYAGGGIGTEGAHLDHAGVFQRYVTDATGKRIGMTIAEQFRGSRGVHPRNYMFGTGWGEGNGSNYHAIMGPDGKPLGGSNNPMSDLRTAAEKLRDAASAQQQAVNRSDLGEERRKLALRDQAASRLEGGIDAHVHLHDGRTSASVERRGVVRDASVTVRRAPQRTATV